MEQENQHPMIIVHDNEEQQEEVEDLSLKITFPHVKDNNNTTVVVTSSFVSNGHSNGTSTIVTDLDEFSLQKDEELEKKRNVGECNSDKEQDCVPVGLGLVANFVGEAIKDDAIFGSESSDIFLQNKNSVFFDKQQGNEVNGLDRVHNGDATNHEESKLDEQVENSAIQTSLRGEVHGINRVQNDDITNHEESKLDEQVEVHRHHGVQNGDATNHDNKVPSSSELSALHNSSDKQATPAVNSNEEIIQELNSIKETDQQEKEYDVELVIAKQETHDLYCPNCKSCITKRVILKKRKRNNQILDNKGKRDRLDSVVDNDVVNPDSTTHEANQGNYEKVTSEITSMDPPPAPVTAAAAAADDDGDDHPEKEVEVFRCLSCFSIFIPSGKGFNLFRNFGGASKDETSQNSSNIPSSSPNWFISLFTSNKRKTATEPGDTSQEYSTTDPADQNQSTITSPLLSSSDIGHPEGTLGDADLIKNVKPTSDVNHGRERMNSTISSNGVQSVVQDFIDFSEKEQSLTRKLRTDNRGKNKTSVDTTNTNTVEVTSSTNFSNGTVSEYKSVKSVTTTSSETFVNSGATAKGAILNHYQEKPEFIVPTSTTIASLIVEKLPKDVNQMPEIVKNNDYDSSLRQDGAQSPVQSFDSTSSAIDGIFPSKTDITLIDTVRKDINGKINPSVINENKGDVIVVVDEEANESTTLQTEGNVPRDGAIVTESPTQVDIGEQPRNEVGEPKKWEIVKSIVYGGLVESITSLGIVSSAASSGATPLNIITLGFANLIGGLFILGHNLKELKDSHSRGQQLQTNVQDRYQELLGNRSNFVFHAVIAVFSFLIFGSVPLIIYGILINKNYYDEVKLAIVAATSVACIILLTVGKVYTRRPPKSYIKTVLYYVTMALAASGLSYIAGKLFKDLLEKFNHSESGFAINMPISDTSMETTWMSS
ncbi:hypothetical protein MtrunA17_Chr5g0428711 [Medicago truncatula]|uniref:Vacuolar iron transporter-like protein n=1 Tax=Medicago truncatula TaxID=3880 RepID=G7K650_MEDTR|nr:vacuolar iron transporter-like protein [Medicago truncatula]RHN56367.1 hypothetical protein MtrunA17_Chr5g0428711 [Medicago truncatula]